MKTTLHHTLILFLLFLFFQETARAQMDQSPMLTWEEFLNEYAAETAPKDQTKDETSGGLSEAEIDQLESLAPFSRRRTNPFAARLPRCKTRIQSHGRTDATQGF